MSSRANDNTQREQPKVLPGWLKNKSSAQEHRERSAAPAVVLADVTLLQLNMEGLTKIKCAIMECLKQEHEAIEIFLQETHYLDISKLKICRYTLAACTTAVSMRLPHW